MVPMQIAITAALGFDSYLVMRHGAGPLATAPSPCGTEIDVGSTGPRLGCYFCNDVVAPIDVILNNDSSLLFQSYFCPSQNPDSIMPLKTRICYCYKVIPLQ
jgi:hypothetical protein